MPEARELFVGGSSEVSPVVTYPTMGDTGEVNPSRDLLSSDEEQELVEDIRDTYYEEERPPHHGAL